jgi:hypothetical protein
MTPNLPFPILTAAEAAEHIQHGMTLGFSGFTPAGAAKAVPAALADRAQRLHAAGEPLRVRILTGASTGAAFDDRLADADVVAWRAPYQSSGPLRKRINCQETQFVDMHLSHVPQMVAFGFFGQMDVAVVEALDVTRDGRVYLTTSVGASPTFLRHADRVIIELNRHASKRLWEMHDIAICRHRRTATRSRSTTPSAAWACRTRPSTRARSLASSRRTRRTVSAGSTSPMRPAARSRATSSRSCSTRCGPAAYPRTSCHCRLGSATSRTRSWPGSARAMCPTSTCTRRSCRTRWSTSWRAAACSVRRPAHSR